MMLSYALLDMFKSKSSVGISMGTQQGVSTRLSLTRIWKNMYKKDFMGRSKTTHNQVLFKMSGRCFRWAIFFSSNVMLERIL
jgi:hypothetical protein